MALYYLASTKWQYIISLLKTLDGIILSRFYQTLYGIILSHFYQTLGGIILSRFYETLYMALYYLASMKPYIWHYINSLLPNGSILSCF